jgi:AcrR family transcriptional regulator
MVLRLKPDRKEEKDRVREELLRAALRLGAAHGFASLGLREVAREADIAPTSFYRHFEDMEALGLSLIRDKIEPLIAEWASALKPSADDPVELVDALFQTIDGDPELIRFLVAERVGSSPALRTALRNTLSALAKSLHGGDAADLVIVLLVDAAAQLLDSTPEGRPALRQRTIERVASAITAAHRAGR